VVNLPISVEPLAEGRREWLFHKLDLIREMIEAGCPVYYYDSSERGTQGERLVDTHLVIRDEDWMRYFNARREPPASC
jgi:hypothetical protein